MNRQQWVIAVNSFRELVRSRIFLILAVFAILMSLLSLILGELTFGDQHRVILDFGLTAIHIVLVILSVFVSVSFLRREIENKLVMSLLSKPISRTDYFLGKFLGGLLLSVVFTSLSFIILRLILWDMDSSPWLTWVQVCAGMIFESSILLALSLFLGMLLQGFTSIATCMGVFLFGHWLDNLNFFAYKSGNEVFIQFAKVMNWIIPNLEVFNWREYLFVGKSASVFFIPALLHSFGWVIILLVGLIFIMRKKDIV